MTDYQTFLARKAIADVPTGFAPHPTKAPLFSFQRDVVEWACRRGRAALFQDCGLGKTIQQLAWAEQVCQSSRGSVLILAPLCVAAQTVREGAKFGIDVYHINDPTDQRWNAIHITNYQKLHRFDLSRFKGIVLDESSILKAYDGATRTEIIEASSRLPYKLACTATPAPNDYMELGNHAEFLGVMSRVEMLATFFVHDGGETSKWRLKGHAETEFWQWLCSWAVNIRKPSDLGYDDGQFQLPPLKLVEHTVESKHVTPGYLFALPAASLDERREARKATIDERVSMAADLAASNRKPWLFWCNLNSESEAITKAIPGAVEITGSDSDEDKERAMMGFLDGTNRVLVTKPSIAGFGLNLQHCAHMAFVGLSDSYEQFYQAVRRCWRFGQRNPVEAHIITSDLEGAVLANIKRKEADAQRMAEEMVRHMAKISSAEIRGTQRNKLNYNPTVPMYLPQWI